MFISILSITRVKIVSGDLVVNCFLGVLVQSEWHKFHTSTDCTDFSDLHGSGGTLIALTI